MEYKFISDLQADIETPRSGILSRVLEKNDAVNITLFALAAGEEISSHSAPTPAVLYFLAGEAAVQLDEDTVAAHAGSFVYMPPMLPHAISAKSQVKMLLVQHKLR